MDGPPSGTATRSRGVGRLRMSTFDQDDAKSHAISGADVLDLASAASQLCLGVGSSRVQHDVFDGLYSFVASGCRARGAHAAFSSRAGPTRRYPGGVKGRTVVVVIRRPPWSLSRTRVAESLIFHGGREVASGPLSCTQRWPHSRPTDRGAPAGHRDRSDLVAPIPRVAGNAASAGCSRFSCVCTRAAGRSDWRPTSIPMVTLVRWRSSVPSSCHLSCARSCRWPPAAECSTSSALIADVEERTRFESFCAHRSGNRIDMRLTRRRCGSAALSDRRQATGARTCTKRLGRLGMNRSVVVALTRTGGGWYERRPERRTAAWRGRLVRVSPAGSEASSPSSGSRPRIESGRWRSSTSARRSRVQRRARIVVTLPGTNHRGLPPPARGLRGLRGTAGAGAT